MDAAEIRIRYLLLVRKSREKMALPTLRTLYTEWTRKPAPEDATKAHLIDLLEAWDKEWFARKDAAERTM